MTEGHVCWSNVIGLQLDKSTFIFAVTLSVIQQKIIYQFHIFGLARSSYNEFSEKIVLSVSPYVSVRSY